MFVNRIEVLLAFEVQPILTVQNVCMSGPYSVNAIVTFNLNVNVIVIELNPEILLTKIVNTLGGIYCSQSRIACSLNYNLQQ